MNIEDIINKIDSTNLSIPFGRIKNISSTTLTAVGLEVSVGDIVKIESVQRKRTT
jgi:flagellum-specific ATP synthase